jgi:hypothetical protein
MTAPSFKEALEAALAAKRPPQTDAERIAAVEAILASTNPADAERAQALRSLLAMIEPQQTLAEICASANHPDIDARPTLPASLELPDIERPPEAQERPLVAPMPLAMGTGQSGETRATDSDLARARLEAEKYRQQRQSVYQSAWDAAVGWLKH